MKLIDWDYAQSLNSPPYGNIWKSTEYTTKENRNAETVDPLHYEMCKDSSDLCEGCPKCVSLYAGGEVVEQCCKDHTCPVWLKDHPKNKAKRVKTLTVEEWKSKISKEEPANPCAGCKFRKYYDCENPSCPIWSRLWWRNNNDGSPLLDQEPVKLKRKIQHAAYALVAWMNNEIKTILEGADV